MRESDWTPCFPNFLKVRVEMYGIYPHRVFHFWYMKGRLVTFASNTIPKLYLQIRNNIISRSTQYVQSVDLCRFCGLPDQAFQTRKLCVFDGPLLNDFADFFDICRNQGTISGKKCLRSRPLCLLQRSSI